MTTCKNCEISFEGKYCPNCSQKADTHRFTVNHFLHEAFHAFTHTDKGVLLLAKELFVRPGITVREFNAGKRKKYFNPITFLLLTTALQIFVAKKTDIFQQYGNAMEVVAQNIATTQGHADKAEVTKQFREQSERPMDATLEYGKTIGLLFIPILAFLTWLLFKRSGFNFAENLVLHVMVSGQLSIFFVVFTALPFLILPSLVILWMMLFMLINWGYSIFAYKQFFQQGWLPSIAKGLLVQLAITLLSTVFINAVGKLFA